MHPVRVHRYHSTDLKKLHCIILVTAIDPACGSGSLLLKAEKILGKDAIQNGFYGQVMKIRCLSMIPALLRQEYLHQKARRIWHLSCTVFLGLHQMALPLLFAFRGLCIVVVQNRKFVSI